MKLNFRHIFGRIIDEYILNAVPKKFRLWLRFIRYTKVTKWESEVLRIRSLSPKGEKALDIGANMGLWTYAMAKSGLFNEVIAFEPNKTLTGDLEQARLKGVRIVNVAVSDSAGISRLSIPRKGNLLLSGWATLESKVDIEVDEFDVMEVQTVRLDDFGYEGVRFVKIDVEGHELDLLAGARKFFSVNRPACIIECREKNRQQVHDYFSSLGVGYRFVDTKVIYGYVLSPGNILFSTT